jgi:UTP:GlnB (protein PII) uridylyltransferase
VHSATMDDVTSDRYSLLEIQAPLEPGVLYRVTQAVSNLRWNIHSARLSLWGSRVRAAFYITTALGAKLEASSITQLNKVLQGDELKSRGISTPVDV